MIHASIVTQLEIYFKMLLCHLRDCFKLEQYLLVKELEHIQTTMESPLASQVLFVVVLNGDCLSVY